LLHIPREQRTDRWPCIAEFRQRETATDGTDRLRDNLRHSGKQQEKHQTWFSIYAYFPQRCKVLPAFPAITKETILQRQRANGNV